MERPPITNDEARCPHCDGTWISTRADASMNHYAGPMLGLILTVVLVAYAFIVEPPHRVRVQRPEPVDTCARQRQ